MLHSVMSDIFHVDYSENLNMHPSVPKGVRETWFVVSRKKAEVNACTEDKNGDERRKKEVK